MNSKPPSLSQDSFGQKCMEHDGTKWALYKARDVLRPNKRMKVNMHSIHITFTLLKIHICSNEIVP